LAREDLRTLSPLIYHHIDPYGTLEMDLSKRLEIAGVWSNDLTFGLTIMGVRAATPEDESLSG
jgi:hypothetical protein